MKKRIKLCGLVAVIFTMLTTFAYPLSYELDLNGDGSWDTGGEWAMSVDDTVRVDVWLDGYACEPNDKLFGVQLYFSFDSKKLEAIDAYANDTDHGGPFDPGLAGFKVEKQPGVYFLVASHFNYVEVSGGRILIGSILLRGKKAGNTTVKAANSLGFGSYQDGFVSDCNLKSFKAPPDGPTDAVARISLSGDNGEDEDEDEYGGESDNEEEYDNRYQDDYPEGRPSSVARDRKSSSISSGIVQTDSNSVRVLTNRSRQIIPETTSDDSDSPAEPISGIRKESRLSSGRETVENRKRKAPEKEKKRASQTTSTTTVAKRSSSSYQILVSPSSVTVSPGGKIQLNAKTVADGKEMEGTYSWKIVPKSMIGSTIDKRGLFIAGGNTTANSVRETVEVLDVEHGIKKEVILTIAPGKQTSKEGCMLSISPSSVTVSPGDTVVFSAQGSGGSCKEGSYEWRVNTEIGSQISQDGLYEAGQNPNSGQKFDIVFVEDTGNNIEGEVFVTVMPGTTSPSTGKISTARTQGNNDSPPAGGGTSKGLVYGILFCILIVAACFLFFRLRR